MMKALPRRTVILSVALAGVLPAATREASAQAVKLRPLAPITSDGKGGSMLRPEGVACGADGSLVVADTGNRRILVYDVTSQAVSPRREIILPEVPYPIKVQVGPDGEIFALDGKVKKIARIGPEGDFRGYVDLEAAGTGGSVMPRSLRLDREGRIYVLDISGGRVLVHSSDGQLVRQVSLPEDRVGISDIAVDTRGALFIIDGVEKQVLSAAPGAAEATPLSARLKEDLDFPAAIAVDGKGRIFVADTHGGGIVILGPDGAFRGRHSAMGWRDGFLRYPTALCAGAEQGLFVADRENNRVQPFVSGP